MPVLPKINIAYIDGANLDKSLKHLLDWKLDYKKFRVWLRDKYKVEQAYIFIGYISKYESRYEYLRRSGFNLIFKEVTYENGSPKGNCDADLIVQGCVDLFEGDLHKAVLVTSDGDFVPLIKVLLTKGSVETILSPAKSHKCSVLIKRTGVRIAYIHDQRTKIELK